MKDSDIVFKAAETITSVGYACCEIELASEFAYRGTKLVREFGELFRPLEHEKKEYGYSCKFAWLTSGEEGNPEDHAIRYMALLFFANYLESEGR